MSYDFAVLAPEFAANKDDAARVYNALCDEAWEDQTNVTPSPAVAAFVADVISRHGVNVDPPAGFLSVDPSAYERGTVVCASREGLMDTYLELLYLARDHGLLLYDPQADWLSEP